MAKELTLKDKATIAASTILRHRTGQPLGDEELAITIEYLDHAQVFAAGTPGYELMCRDMRLEGESFRGYVRAREQRRS